MIRQLYELGKTSSVLDVSVKMLSPPVAILFSIAPCSEPVQEFQEILCVLRQIEELLPQISQVAFGS